MLLSSTVLLLASALVADARPATNFASVLTSSPSALRSLPIGKTAISRNDMTELGRLASIVNAAYCPMDNQLQPAKLDKVSRHQRRSPTNRHGSSIVMSSNDEGHRQDNADLDMSWYILHTPATSTLTLSFTSLPSVDELLELLASSPKDNSTELLTAMPSYLFPPEYLPTFPPPRMHHSYVSALETHGVSALLSVLDLLESPPMVPAATDLLSIFKRSAPLPELAPIKKVEIIGHGLGASVGLLVALALHLEVSGPAALAYDRPLEAIDISTTLFGQPRVGDQAFADWVDEVVSREENFSMNRIVSYADTIPHLPARHLELAHPSMGEIWVGADPRTAYACVAESVGEESSACSESIPLPSTSLLDHAGPFAGVWIGKNSCQRNRDAGL
ncbi:hypothetical protein P7C73_g2501, partial [Tremellales sp. Uapishka_1]